MKSDKKLGVGDGEIGTMLDIDAVTFDHFMTLVRPAKGTGKDIVFPIVRSLLGKVTFDEGEFLRIYRQKDDDYRRDLRETCCECLLDEIVLGALRDMGFETEAMRERVHSSVEAGLATKNVVLYPDTLETLETLRERRYLLGIISNTHWRWLEEHRRAMETYFDVITLSYEHGFAKPHPSIFQTTLEKLGVRADRCLHVGDDPTADIQGAREAGLKTAFVRRDEVEADSDIQIEQLFELLLYL
jgi:HAD superfamily hydrolase (TIGR01549 family)